MKRLVALKPYEYLILEHAPPRTSAPGPAQRTRRCSVTTAADIDMLIEPGFTRPTDVRPDEDP